MGPCPSHQVDMNLSTRDRNAARAAEEKTVSKSLCEDFLEEVTLHQDSEQKGPSRQGA